MKHLEGPITALIVLISAMLALKGGAWLDNAIQKARGIEADQFGRRKSGVVAKATLVIVGGGLLLLYFSQGGANPDPELLYRR